MPKGMAPTVNVGDKIGTFTIIEMTQMRTSDGRRIYVCKCDCGAIKTTSSKNLRHRKTCGHGVELHGESATPKRQATHEYRTWQQMLRRCYTATNKSFPEYGGRGITVCDEWRRSFTEFLRYMGRKPSPVHSIDRIDGTKGYFPGNVRWATPKEQARNMRTNCFATLDGVTRTYAEWAEAYGISNGLLHNRMRTGWELKEALTTPARHKKRKAA